MEKTLTVKQVAELLQLHEMTIRRYIRAGKLDAVRVGRRIRIPRVAVEKMMSSQAEESGSVLREPAVAYHTGEAAPVKVLPPSIEQITADLVALDAEGRVKAGDFIADLRAEREKQEWEETKDRILKKAHQMALERADWSREKVVEHFKEVADKILRQAIEKGTAIEGDWLDD